MYAIISTRMVVRLSTSLYLFSLLVLVIWCLLLFIPLLLLVVVVSSVSSNI